MDWPNWLVWIGVVALALLVVGGLALLVSTDMPTPENRPAPIERTADLERQRDEALRRIADRQRYHQQRQREASARITRGY